MGFAIGFLRKIGWSHSHSKKHQAWWIKSAAQPQLLAIEQRLQPFNWQNLGIALSAQPGSSIQNPKHYVDIEPTTNSKKFTGQDPVFSSTPSTTGPTPLKNKNFKTPNLQLPTSKLHAVVQGSPCIEMSHHHVQRCQVSCHAEGEARRQCSRRRRRRRRRHRGPGNHGDDDIGRWNLLGHYRVWGLITVKYQNQTLQIIFWLLFVWWFL